VLASTLGESEESCASTILAAGSIAKDRPGSDKYQKTHMAQIFQDGLSFSGFERNKVFLNDGKGKFFDLSDVSGADSEGDCRAACVADFDDDGDPDLFVNAAQRRLFHLYRNDLGNRSGFKGVKVALKGTKGRPDAVGAIVMCERGGRTQAQVLGLGGGFESQHAPELIFGLGAHETARVKVRWPGRAVEDFGEIGAGSNVLLVEGSGKPELRSPRPFAFRDPTAYGVKLRSGDAFPAFVMKNAAGGEVRVEKGEKKLLVNFWATTCRSCLAETPDLEKLAASGRYRVVGVSTDEPSRAAAVEATARKFGATYEIGILPEEAAARLVDLDKLLLPTTLVVGVDGKVEKILQGRLKEGDL
jgi:thiol-disulfide isomerase/thioredoxin